MQVYHGRVLRDSAAKLRDVPLSDGDSLVLLPGRTPGPLPARPVHASRVRLRGSWVTENLQGARALRYQPCLHHAV